MEWAERIKNVWPDKYIRIDFKNVEYGTRKIKFSARGKKISLDRLKGKLKGRRK